MPVDWKKYEGQLVHEKFPLQRFLGSTSHSAVFSTKFGPQSKNAAIKFLSAGARADFQEALWRRASHLSHPQLLHVLGGGRCLLGEMDLLYLVMEYAEEDLGQVLPNRALAAKETHDLLVPLLGALVYLHSKGFAHGHLKPSNILAIGDRLKLTSDTAIPLGESCTPHRPADAYDAPEAGTALTAASLDVWSLGMTLVETLTQHVPVLSADRQADPIVPSGLPQPFLDIARQSLRRDPRLRWTTAQIAECLSPAPTPVAPGAEVDAAKTAAAPIVSPQATGKTGSSPIATPEVTADSGKAAPAPVGVPEVTADSGKTAPPPSAAPAVPAAAGVASAGKPTESAAEMWDDITYTWVVLCKNYFFHMRQNLFFRHRIPLAYTDPFAPVPEVDGPFKVKCDDCGRTYLYRRSNLRRYQGEVPKFTTHPLF